MTNRTCKVGIDISCEECGACVKTCKGCKGGCMNDL